jgi:rSAM/selenodomain-associated transferase 1
MIADATSTDKSCAIAVMAKALRPTHVKTRLVPPLTHEMAVSLGAGFLRDITENIRLAARDAAIRGYVAYAPAGYEALFDGVLSAGTQLVLADGAADAPPRVQGFGRCLLQAAQALFARGHQSVCLLNSDSPTLPTALLSQAARVLAEADDRVVLGPAEDGGYYVIGLKAPHAALFEDIAWSTDKVAGQTRDRARNLGLEVFELAAWYDVDDHASLLRLLRGFVSKAAGDGLPPYAAPATAACVERLRLYDLLDIDKILSGLDDRRDAVAAISSVLTPIKGST